MPGYKSVELKFDEMDIEESPNCAKDRVTILNGNDVDAIPLGSYCGNKVPRTIQSSTEVVTIQFISDGTVNKKGFNLQYKGLQNRITGTYVCKGSKICMATVYLIAYMQVGMDAILYHLQLLNLVCLLFHQSTMAQSIVYTTYFQQSGE